MVNVFGGFTIVLCKELSKNKSFLIKKSVPVIIIYRNALI